MTPTTPIGEPTTLVQGAAWSWDVTYSDFPSDESWQLRYYLRGPDDFDLTFGTHVAADGSGGYEVRVTAAQSLAGVDPGAYRLIGRVNKTSHEFDGTIVYNAHLLVLADPTTAVNAESHNRQMLDAIDAALLAGAGDSAEFKSVALNGRTVTYRDRAEMEKARTHYALLVALEENPDAEVYRAGEFVNA